MSQDTWATNENAVPQTCATDALPHETVSTNERRGADEGVPVSWASDDSLGCESLHRNCSDGLTQRPTLSTWLSSVGGDYGLTSESGH